MLTDVPAFSGFTVDDIPAATAFYADVLGLQVTEDQRHADLAPRGGDRPTLVYPKADHVPATYTILNFPVDDIDAAVASWPRAASVRCTTTACPRTTRACCADCGQAGALTSPGSPTRPATSCPSSSRVNRSGRCDSSPDVGRNPPQDVARVRPNDDAGVPDRRGVLRRRQHDDGRRVDLPLRQGPGPARLLLLDRPEPLHAAPGPAAAARRDHRRPAHAPASRRWPSSPARTSPRSSRWARRSTTRRWPTRSGRARTRWPSSISTPASGSGWSPRRRSSWPRSSPAGSS